MNWVDAKKLRDFVKTLSKGQEMKVKIINILISIYYFILF